MSRPDHVATTSFRFPLLTACRQGRSSPGSVQALPELLRQLHHCFRLPCERMGVEFQLELDPALSTPLLLDAVRLQALVRHWLAAALQDGQLRQISLRVQLLAQQQMQQIISVEVSTVRHVPLAGLAPHALARARKPTTAALSSAVISRQLARQLGSRQHCEYQADGQQYSVLLHAPLASPGTLPQPWQWPILLLEPDAGRAAELAGQWQVLGYPFERVDTATAARQRWQQGPLALLLVSERQWLNAGLELAQSIRACEAAEPWRGHTPLLLAGADPLSLSVSTLPLLDASLPWPPEDAAWLRAVTGCLPVVPPAAIHLPVLDRQVLFGLSQGDWALELPLLQDFARDKQADLQQLLQAWQRSDQQTFILLAHRIKGASRTVGAAAMADCAARLEAEARAGLSAACMALVLELEQALDDFVDHLQHG